MLKKERIMAKSRWFLNAIGMIGLVGLLAACGSGGAPSVSASGSGSGTGSGSASASGTITNFGSVYVNGKKFETPEVDVTHDDQSIRCSIGVSNTCGLKKGMIVTVQGSLTDRERRAASVRRHDVVEGLVQSVAVDGLSIVVMGQTVLIDDTTIFDNTVRPVAGDNVEVSGHIRPHGVIQATFIEKKPVGTVTPEVHGYVTEHNHATKTFKIGSLVVNYATAVINDMPAPSGTNWNDLLVEAKGNIFDAATTTLTATKVEPEHLGVGDNVDELEVEGYVMQVLGSGDFFIGTTHVQTTSTTEFRGGTIEEIVVGAKLSAEGRYVNGILTAKHVRFHESVRVEGDIETIGANSFTITGLTGVTVTVNRQTELKNTTLASLTSGSHVRVRGRVNGTHSVIAARVELRSADSDLDLQGPVQALSDPNLAILGVTIDTTGVEFKEGGDRAISRAAFFSTVKVGALVKMQGRLNGSVVTWREVELEDEDE